MDVVSLEQEVEATCAVFTRMEAVSGEYEWTVICSYQFVCAISIWHVRGTGCTHQTVG